MEEKGSSMTDGSEYTSPPGLDSGSAFQEAFAQACQSAGISVCEQRGSTSVLAP